MGFFTGKPGLTQSDKPEPSKSAPERSYPWGSQEALETSLGERASQWVLEPQEHRAPL